MFAWLTHNLLWTESLWIVFGVGALALFGYFLWPPLILGALLLFLFCFYFFRNPDRVCVPALTDDRVIVCPADGKIVAISPDEKKVSIFLSPFNVHVNWTPIGGTIEKITYVPGTFMFALLPKSSEFNEHNDVVIRHPSGKKVTVRQIAGMIARRIVCWAKEGDSVAAGQKYGMIKFSSRVDILLPEGAHLAVKMGDRVYGGQTVLGTLG